MGVELIQTVTGPSGAVVMTEVLLHMKLHQSRFLLCSALGCALATRGAAQGRPGGPRPRGPAERTGVYTTVSGTISQFNYDRDAEIEGFLLSNNTLVHLTPPTAVRIGNSVHKGDSVQIAGYAQNSPSGVQMVEAQSVEDRTLGKTFSTPQPGAAAPYSGSGRIQQLNYGPDGAINGFLFDNGTLAAAPPFAATNPSFIRVGATVAYAGYARTTASGRTVVDVQSVTINGQQLALGGPGGVPAPPPPPPAAAGPAGPPPPPAGGPAAPAPPAVSAPAGRTDEPPAPPPPPARPSQV
jgi:hypothetical protein